MGKESAEKVFLVGRSVVDDDDFKDFAEIMKRLKPYGKVCIAVSGLSEKAFHEMPETPSPWHEYATYLCPIHRFFPHPTIEPHVPKDWIAKNRNLVLKKTEILKDLGLSAHWWGCDPFYLPDSFFDEYPHLRGPRVDHPRRSSKAEFSCCTDLEETKEMVRWSFAELKKNVPILETYHFLTNDSGAGFCWSDYLYSEKNGPRSCQTRNMGERMRDFIQAMHDGAIEGGGDIDIHCRGNLKQDEYDQLVPIAPPRTYLSANFRGDSTTMNIGNLQCSPSRGLFDPWAFVQTMQRFHNPKVRNCYVTFETGYFRGPELLSTCDKMVDVMIDCIEEPSPTLFSRMEKIRKLSEQWGGRENTDKILEAFYSLNQSFSKTAGKHRTFFEAVSNRHATRPLVVKPELLTKEETDYFLPHIFNPSEHEALTDYVDIHGGRKDTSFKGDWFWDGAFQGALSSLKSIAQTFESIEDAPEQDMLKQIGMSLRIYVSAVRSCNNFYFAQVYRDRHKEELASEEPITQPKDHSRALPDYTQWFEIAQDEWHNVQELIALLENGGKDIIITAKTAREEDCFLLGPDIIDQLKKKAQITRDHWLDVEKYVVTPMK